MTRWLATAVAIVLALCGVDATAHRIDEVLQASLVTIEPDRVEVSMRIIPGALVASAVIADMDHDGDGLLSVEEQHDYAERVLRDLSITIDGDGVRPVLRSWSFPSPRQIHEGLGEIRIAYAIAVPRGAGDRTLVLSNHHLAGASVHLANVLVPKDADIEVVAQQRDPSQSTYRLDYRMRAAPSTPSTDPQAWWNRRPPGDLVRLGMHHIAEGTDHLLFLLVLLLPAPLCASNGRWGGSVSVRRSLLRILGIVTAFTVGHSITLMLSAVGGIVAPSRPVEVLIACSILVSAVHAWRPIFPGREPVVAALFGLAHGLAFATVLDHLGASRVDRAVETLAFNLGVEAMQLLVVAAVLPSLLLLGRSSAYPLLRIGGALFAVAASIAWIVERLFDIRTPVDAIVDGLASHAVWIAAMLLAGLVVRRPGGGGRRRSARPLPIA